MYNRKIEIEIESFLQPNNIVKYELYGLVGHSSLKSVEKHPVEYGTVRMIGENPIYVYHINKIRYGFLNLKVRYEIHWKYLMAEYYYNRREEYPDFNYVDYIDSIKWK
jgi:hypothetical protein